MPREPISGTDAHYWLACYDAHGRERRDDPDGLISERIIASLRAEPVTDIFLFCHGWRNDVPAAQRSYQAWVAAMAQHAAGAAQMRERRPAFHPLLVGLHWPSQPFGEEDLPLSTATVAHWAERYAGRIADTDPARAALRTILAAAAADPEPQRLADPITGAYLTLGQASGLTAAGLAGAPGEDHDALDPISVYDAAGRMIGDSSFKLWRGILSGVGVLSFWTMKQRARTFGEGGARDLLLALIQHSGPEVHIHLMGHSFGSIVLAGMVTGPSGQGWLPRPVQSMVLVQGALSLWSFSAQLPFDLKRPGYFHRVLSGQVVDGPIATTYSPHDLAVSFWYPLGARIGPQDFAPGDLPRYGALGAFGAHGDGITAIDTQLHPVDQPYQFTPGAVLNLDSAAVIRQGSWPEGAHNDITHPEVAHLVWSAALPGSR